MNNQKTAYGYHGENNEFVVTEDALVGAGKGDAITTIYGRTVRLSTRKVRVVARFPRTRKGEQAAIEMCNAHAATLKVR